jgi:hypothetical protein
VTRSRVGRRPAVSWLLLAALALAGCGDEPPREPQAALSEAPAGIGDSCREVAADVDFEVLCPGKWPQATRPARTRLRPIGGSGTHAYLLEANESFGPRSPVFHVLLGGRDQPFPPSFARAGRDLRVPTRDIVVPIHSGPGGGPSRGTFVQERPARRIGTTTVHGERAAVLVAPPYPQGGIHGGHSIVMWNEGGRGYLVSAHSEASRRSATATAIAIARSFRPL